jgi:hypothetical protein
MKPDHYLIAVRLTAATSAALALFVLFFAPKRRLTKLYTLHVTAIGLWSVYWWQMMTAKDFHSCMYYCHLLHVPAVFIPSLFLLFVQCLLNIDRNPNQRRMRMAIVIVAMAFVPLFLTEQFIPTRMGEACYPYLFEPGPLYIVYTSYFICALGISFYLLYKGHKNSTGFQRTQIAHIIGAYGLGYSGGLGVFLLIYQFPIPPWILYLIPLAHTWVLYAILRHRLMEIRVIIRRTGLLLLIYLVLLVALTPILEAMHPRTSIPLVEILMAGAILSIGPFLYAFVARRSAYFHEDTIAGLTHEMKTPLATIQSALEIINSATPLST